MPNVKGYIRRSTGVRVRPHWRRPAASSGTGSAAGVVLLVAVIVGLATHGASPGSASSSLSGSSMSGARDAPAGDAALGAAARIVQVSSHRDAGLARAQVRDLRARGLRAGVLDSSRYRPYRGGFQVVYVGPYPMTPAGQAAAQKVSATLPGSWVCDVSAR